MIGVIQIITTSGAPFWPLTERSSTSSPRRLDRFNRGKAAARQDQYAPSFGRVLSAGEFELACATRNSVDIEAVLTDDSRQPALYRRRSVQVLRVPLIL